MKIWFLLLVVFLGCTVQPTPQPNQKVVYTIQDCGLQNCHGLQLSCGPNIPQKCAESYEFGDGCRQYAYCNKGDGLCKLVREPRFEECRACVEECKGLFDETDTKENEKMWLCEEECLK